METVQLNKGTTSISNLTIEISRIGEKFTFKELSDDLFNSLEGEIKNKRHTETQSSSIKELLKHLEPSLKRKMYKQLRKKQFEC